MVATEKLLVQPTLLNHSSTELPLSLAVLADHSSLSCG